MSKKYTLLTFKVVCINFLLKLKLFILGRPVTSKQPHKIVQILLGHPVDAYSFYTKLLFSVRSKVISYATKCNLA